MTRQLRRSRNGKMSRVCLTDARQQQCVQSWSTSEPGLRVRQQMTCNLAPRAQLANGCITAKPYIGVAAGGVNSLVRFTDLSRLGHPVTLNCRKTFRSPKEAP